jgi:predicted short-subunit dehydrogenase-like oxidoreductase (DUF2520 family)
MRIALIGCGRVGVTIFYLLKRNKKNTIVGVYDTDKRQEKAAIKMLRIKHNPRYREIIEQSEALFIATPDDAILKAYRKMRKYLWRNKCIFHFSGLLPADILPAAKGIYRASVHPFATFPKIIVPPKRQRFFLSLEGDPRAVKNACAIFHSKYFAIKRIEKETKTFYHLIGVFSSNLLVGLIASIHDIAAKCGWKAKDIRQLVYPILEETLNNIKEYGIRESLSGPLQRGDTGAIGEHLHVLQNDKDLLNVYKTLSRVIINNALPGKRRNKWRKMLR